MSFLFRKVEDVTTISKSQSLTSVCIKDCTLRVPNKTTALFLLRAIIKAIFTSLLFLVLSLSVFLCLCVCLFFSLSPAPSFFPKTLWACLASVSTYCKVIVHHGRTHCGSSRILLCKSRTVKQTNFQHLGARINWQLFQTARSAVSKKQFLFGGG